MHESFEMSLYTTVKNKTFAFFSYSFKSLNGPISNFDSYQNTENETVLTLIYT